MFNVNSQRIRYNTVNRDANIHFNWLKLWKTLIQFNIIRQNQRIRLKSSVIHMLNHRRNPIMFVPIYFVVFFVDAVLNIYTVIPKLMIFISGVSNIVSRFCHTAYTQSSWSDSADISIIHRFDLQCQSAISQQTRVFQSVSRKPV